MSTMLCTRCIGRVPATRSLFAAAARRTYADDAAPNPLTTPLTPGPSKLTAEQSIVRSTVPAGTKLFNINYFKNKPDPVAMEDGEYPAWLWSGLESGKSAAESAEEAGDLYSKSKKSRQLAKKRAAKLAAQNALNPEKKIPIHEQTIDLPFVTVTDPAHGPAKVAPITKTVSAVGSVVKKLGKVKVAPSTITIGGNAELQVTAEDAAKARQEVRKALRQKGRAKIKEANFLAQM